MRRLVVLYAVIAVVVAGASWATWAHVATPPTPSTSDVRATNDLQTAAAVVNALESGGLPVTDDVACLPPTDDVDGAETRPMVAFRDTRVTRSYLRPVVAAGGVVEVLESPHAVRARVDQLDRQTRIAGEFGYDEMGRALHRERRYQVGRILLRLTGSLSPAQASAYRHQFTQAVTRRVSTHDLPEEKPCSI